MKSFRDLPQSISVARVLPAMMVLFSTLFAQDERAVLSGSGAEQTVTLAFTKTYTQVSLKPRDEDGKTYDGDLVDTNEWSTEIFNGNDDLIEESTNYEYGVKQVTKKISNKEFLEDLIGDNIIEGPITGWSLKFVTSDDPASTAGRFYAVKIGSQPVDLSEIISIEGFGYADTESEKWSSKTTYKYANEDSSQITKNTWSFSSKWMTNMEFKFSFSESYFYLYGIFNESWSLKSFGKGEDQYWQYAPSAAKFDNGSGTRYTQEEYENEGGSYSDYSEESIIKGAFSLSAGKLFQDIRVPYPDYEHNYDENY